MANNSNNRQGYHADYYLKNRDRLIEYRKVHAKQIRKESPVKAMLASAKARAKQFNLDFDLSDVDIELPTICPVLNIPLQINEGTRQNNSYSLDRIDPNKGYTKGNVQVISALANSMKTDASSEHLLAFAEWVFKTYKET